MVPVDFPSEADQKWYHQNRHHEMTRKTRGILCNKSRPELELAFVQQASRVRARLGLFDLEPIHQPFLAAPILSTLGGSLCLDGLGLS